MADDLEWQDPPAETVRKVDRVAAQLDANPGRWALIEQGPFSLVTWWGPLANDNRYEVKRVPEQPGAIFGPRKIYARRIHVPSGRD
jgi:hypothetical protein